MNTDRKPLNAAKFVVRSANGAVDREMTLAAWASDLDAFIATDVPVDMTPVANAIGEVFAAMPNAQSKTLETKVLVARALKVLNPPHEQEAAAMNLIETYIKGESAKFASSNGSEGAYYTGRGAGAGTSIRSEAIVAKFRASAAARASKNAPVPTV